MPFSKLLSGALNAGPTFLSQSWRRTDFDKGYKMRTELRRMIDVGILGMVNDHEASKEGAESPKTLHELANNIIAHPEKEKYRRFKINNPKIKKDIMEPKGVLEFAIKLRVMCPRLGNRMDIVQYTRQKKRILSVTMVCGNRTWRTCRNGLHFLVHDPALTYESSML
ncbi:uncharacterized protein BT62DRAFT_619873 [Guyanagaster necrorhizus]|uniref:PUB domain-containing protein n=1 Tax=Guyanagaster necrorhizus TaxID=856835 RepID=A0A9P7VYP1_9AGAR|nr:uncharacterized protein BT62DRAFT_619873 [Guyanagaster necrorhizus MCA 3950]KAG7450016.1 hypothetical protein BT62DRAFT_619873 [Guyanagaster necrorhizus MCA 3950]